MRQPFTRILNMCFLALICSGLVFASTFVTGAHFAARDLDTVQASQSPDISEIVASVRKKTKVPAIAAALVTPDAIQSVTDGRRRFDQTTPVTPTDLFHTGSVTKSMTATLAGKLVEAGKLKWDTTVSDAFPEFAAEIDPALQSVTLFQLLGHRSGLALFVAGKELLSANQYAGTPSEQRLALARDLLTKPPRFQVGSFHYSNAGYGIAGAIIERAASESWENLIAAQVFSSSGASSLIGWPGFENEAAPWGHFEKGTIYHQPGQRFTPHNPNDPANLYFRFPSALAPSGDVSLTAQGMGFYAQMHLRGLMGIDSWLRSETIQYLHHNEFIPGTEGSFYSAGWFEGSLDGVATSVHNGSADTFFCVIALQPERGKAAVAIVNAGGDRGAKAAYATVEKLLGVKNLGGLISL